MEGFYWSKTYTNYIQQGFGSKKAKLERAKVDEELEEEFGEDSDTARSFYDKLLIHYASMMSTKEDKQKGRVDALHTVQRLTGQYAQV